MAKRHGQEAEVSLEVLEERAFRDLAREEEDEEVALADLVDAMVPPEPGQPGEPETLADERRAGEFTCSSCHLVYSRSCLADPDRLMCIDCVREASLRRSQGRRARHRITIEAPCPACGEIVMVPEREDAACGFFCPGCGVHVRRWDGHLHLVWNHRYAPQLLPPRRSQAG